MRRLSTLSKHSDAKFTHESMLQNKTTLSAQQAHLIFYKAVRKVILARQWLRIMKMKLDGDQHLEIVDALSGDTTSVHKDRFIDFNPAFYRASKSIELTTEMVFTLTIPTNQRTTQQIQAVMYGLRHLDSFKEYPKHVLEKLCRVAFYHVVSRKRVIIRQGHYAQNFYFILKGRAVVNKLARSEVNGAATLRPVAILKEGTSFGEIALLNKSMRTASVISQEQMQLLAIGRKDFFDIFTKSKEGILAEHIAFLSSIPLFDGFPMEVFSSKPHTCLQHFFKNGLLICDDNKKSEWIYVVKTGQCQVLKQLQVIKKEKQVNTVKLNFGIRNNVPRIVCWPCGIQRSQTMPAVEVHENFDQEYTKSNTTVGGANFVAMVKNTTSSDNVHNNDDSRTVFLEVDKLRPGDIFGLSSLSFGIDTDMAIAESGSVSLASCIAECVMINKKTFMNHMPDVVRERIRCDVRQYPTDHQFLSDLKTARKWDDYRDNLYLDVLAHQQKCRSLSVI